jgi:CMP-N-acetylneuraminic acid synthetase
VAAFEAAYPERDSLFSVTRIQRRLWSETGAPVNHDPEVLIPTQDLSPLFEENSCLYLFAREVIESRRNRIGERPLLWELERREAFDIDVESEFELAELLLRPAP